MSPTVASESQKIAGIQVLRGVAATMVAAFHLNAAQNSGGDSGFFWLFRHGNAGVDVFFVISGFIIFFKEKSRQERDARTFLIRRFWRVVPPYWAVLSLYIIGAFVLYKSTGDGSNLPNSASLAISYLLLPYPEQIITIAWTLSIEILFYIIFAVTFLIFGEMIFIASLLLWIVCSQIYAEVGESEFLVYVLHPSVFNFILGVLVAELHLMGVRRWRNEALIGGTALIIVHLLGAFETGQVAVDASVPAGIAAALMIYGVLDRTWLIPPILLLWGEASYILYLSHVLIYAVSGKVMAILFQFDVYESTPALMAMLAGALIGSCLASYYVERPYQRWYRRFLSAPSS